MSCLYEGAMTIGTGLPVAFLLPKNPLKTETYIYEWFLGVALSSFERLISYSVMSPFLRALACAVSLSHFCIEPSKIQLIDWPYNSLHPSTYEKCTQHGVGVI
jgi:hypothetical protein